MVERAQRWLGTSRRLRRAANRSGAAEGGRHRRVPRRTVAVSAGAVVLLAVAGGAYALTRSGSDRYTTATAQTGTVTQTVTGPGTVASASSATVAFQVSGSVATVDVALGDQVDAGQTLATLDRTSLEAAVTSAQESLDEAEQQRADDQSAQQSTSSTSSSEPASSSGSGSSGTGSSGTSWSDSTSGSTGTSGISAEVSAAVAEVAAAQEVLLSAFAEASAAQATSSAALAALSADDSTAWCAELVALDPAQVTTDSTSVAEPDEETTKGEPAGSGTSLSTVQGWVASCQAALTEIGSLQTATDTAQAALSSAMTTLDGKVAALQQIVGSSGAPDGAGTPDAAGSTDAGPTQAGDAAQASGPTSTGSTGAGTTSSGSTGTGSTSTGSSAATTPSGTSSGRSSTPTAADLVADQAAIDAAEAQVAVATADLQFATLTTPLSGTVAAVDLAVGDQVSASSTTATITVIGDAGYQVSLSVGLGSVDVVEVGQSATVTVPSTDETLDGTVTSIGVLNVSTDSTPQYTVTIRLAATDAPLYDGSSAQATITVAGAADVLTVPTSAVHVDGTTATVDVLADGAVRSATVVRGAVGAELTEITDGLSAGDTVVLADRTQPLQEESTQSSGSGSSWQRVPGDFSGGPPSSMQRPGG